MKFLFFIICICQTFSLAYSETGVDCCPGIAEEPVTPETCASGAENRTMCVGSDWWDCECTGDYAKVLGKVFCSECTASRTGLFIFLVFILPIIICLASICTCICCCRCGNNQNVYQIIKYGKTPRYGNKFSVKMSNSNGMVPLDEIP